MKERTLVVIPARIGSTRLSKKPLIKIGGITMIERAAMKVMESGLANIYVATDDSEIVDALTKYGIKTIMTDPNCLSGTDRAYEAWQNLANQNDFDYILNVQGDMPFIEPSTIFKVAETLWHSKCDIVTPVAKVGIEEAASESNVKVVVNLAKQAMYFSRSLIPNGAEEFLYHVGVYGYKASSLTNFVKLPASFLEKAERLEQLRAIENGMTIEVCEVNDIPMSIDTPADLKKAEDYYNSFAKANEHH